MAGQLKVGGNIIASHSGVEGAGEVTLQNVTLGDSAVPSRSMNFRNKIINGDMRIAQRGTSSSVSGLLGMQIDRFQCEFYGVSVTHSQETLNNGLPYDNGLRYFYRMSNTSPSNNVTDYSRFTYKFESQDISCSGWNYKDSSSSIVISFYARSSLSGTYYLQLFAPNSSHQIRKSFTLVENVWKKIELTISGNSNLVFNNDVNHGLTMYIPAFYGTNWTDSSASLTDWQDYVNSNQTLDFNQNWCNTSSATFDITGVQLEAGTVPTPFEHRPYGVELALCQRYYSIISSVDCSAYYVAGQNAPTFNFSYPQTMRATPVITISRQSNDSTNLTSIIQRNQTPNSFNLYLSGTATGAVNFGHNGNEATLLMDAELL